jgi:hypothetical protein
MNDGRALSYREVLEIQKNVWRGCYHDRELDRLFETYFVQRRVLMELFSLFKQESPLRRVSVTEPIVNSQLAHYKELVSLEDRINLEEV